MMDILGKRITALHQDLCYNFKIEDELKAIVIGETALVQGVRVNRQQENEWIIEGNAFSLEAARRKVRMLAGV
jgi:hypothetical protein